MENRKINIQLFAEEPTATAPETSTDAPQNFEQLYTDAVGEIERLKKQMSKVNSENADYKRKMQAQMTDEEKRVAEQNDLLAKLQQAEEQLNTYKLRDDLVKQGFTAQEIEMLVKGNCSAEVYVKIMNDRLMAQAESLKAQNLVNSTTTPPVGTIDGTNEPLTYAQRILKNGNDNGQDIKSKFNK